MMEDEQYPYQYRAQQKTDNTIIITNIYKGTGLNISKAL